MGRATRRGMSLAAALKRHCRAHGAAMATLLRIPSLLLLLTSVVAGATASRPAVLTLRECVDAYESHVRMPQRITFIQTTEWTRLQGATSQPSDRAMAETRFYKDGDRLDVQTTRYSVDESGKRTVNGGMPIRWIISDQCLWHQNMGKVAGGRILHDVKIYTDREAQTIIAYSVLGTGRVLDGY